MFEYPFDSKLMCLDLLEHVVAKYYPQGLFVSEKNTPRILGVSGLAFWVSGLVFWVHPHPHTPAQ